MNQLKPMIIVLLMLTSALAGCTGTDTTDLEQQIEDLQLSNDILWNRDFYSIRNLYILSLELNILLSKNKSYYQDRINGFVLGPLVYT